MRAFASTLSTAKPSRRSTSGSSTLNILAAMPTSDLRTSVAAIFTAWPPTVVLRDATVGPESCTESVSTLRTVTRGSGMPRISETIWALTVRAPWPMSVSPTPTSALASCDTCTLAPTTSTPSAPLEMPCSRHATPRPKRYRPSAAGSGGRAPRRASTASMVCTMPTDAGYVCPVALASPATSAFFRRSASGSRPSFRASSSMFDSEAKVDCGTPKPRQAPL